MIMHVLNQQAQNCPKKKEYLKVLVPGPVFATAASTGKMTRKKHVSSSSWMNESLSMSVL
jgi:hypothetical protein